jgi:hypothetical protein
MGGTGLEPVTPACRFGAAVRAGSRMFGQVAWLSRIRPAGELGSERERTSSVAIVATLLPTFSAGACAPTSQSRSVAVWAPTEPATNRDDPQPASGPDACRPFPIARGDEPSALASALAKAGKRPCESASEAKGVSVLSIHAQRRGTAPNCPWLKAMAW